MFSNFVFVLYWKKDYLSPIVQIRSSVLPPKYKTSKLSNMFTKKVLILGVRNTDLFTYVTFVFFISEKILKCKAK